MHRLRTGEEKPVRIALIDDAPEIRAQLSEYVTRFGKENSMQLETLEFPSGDALLKDYSPVYDLLIFDIDMPGTNGMDTARQVRRMGENVVILFITNIAQYAINGYEVEAVDYVLKPISYFDFSMKFKRALRRVRKKEEDRLVLDTLQGPVQVGVSDIRYVEVLDHYLTYHTKDQTYQVRGSFREHLPVLKEHHFSRCHKSYMVNLAYVKNIRSSGVVLEDLIIPLGRTYKDSIMEDYLHFLHG